MPCWRIVFSTFRGCMSFYTARVTLRHPPMSAIRPLRGHSGHQPSELSARPPSLAISLPVALLGGFEFFALPLFKLALALLGLGDLPPVVLKDAAVTRFVERLV
jgi:hypothetical protein